ncbi:galactose mutarotase-like protein [Panaeolus papilionaceus]|nr:galactose mutarotase-like protein [Panaeolus papilionaceus]
MQPLNLISISSPDLSAIATFIPFGATTTSFQVKDKSGHFRDILLGFDDTTLYQSDLEGHPYFGAVIGRIRNATFTIPISKNASGPNRFSLSQNQDNNTAHGGFKGYDRRVWTVEQVSAHSVTFSLVDPDGTEGFPGTVITTVTYKLESKATWKISMKSTASALTPIMLTGHHYWNLEAYQESQTLDAHFMEARASKYLATDEVLLPTGQLSPVANTSLDLREARSLGRSISNTPGGIGYDHCLVFNKPIPNVRQPAVSLWSTNSGIKMDIFTNQIAVQVYTCNYILTPGLPIPRKKSQGGPTEFYDNHSCVAIEPESLLDAINNPETGVDQIYGPGRPYVWEAEYSFSNI